jgi:aspartyl-tRNA(Asn)/glutamyl-tRNA(Gln) amidotransferase subunit A
MRPDLTRTLQALREGRTAPTAELELCLSTARSAACAGAFLRLDEAGARQAAHATGAAASRLGGLAVSVKDLFDVAGQTTAAGSKVLHDAPPARRDATAVERLRAAGAAVLGRTHMTEFAFSGVGTNPHHPVPANPADPATPRIPGGSSSGAAVSVATGAAFVGLGSDTGGSIRIPAALQGLVGFKNTARLTPLQGAVPLSTTLDTASAITRSVRDAVLMDEVLAQRTVALQRRGLAGWRLAVSRTLMQDGLDSHVAAVFERSLAALRRAGARIDEIDLPGLSEFSQLQSKGGLTAAESWAWHRTRLATQESAYDPRVAHRIQRGAQISAADYIDLHQARRAWMQRMEETLRGHDAVLSPTVPIVAAPIASIAQDDDEFFRVNALLLRNTSVVNMLDGCALSLPCHAAGEMPVGLMVWAPELQDDRVLSISADIESHLHALES